LSINNPKEDLMADKATNQSDREQIEQRSMGAVVTQFLDSANTGAGVTAGALAVNGAVNKVKDVLGKDGKPKEK
jgi:hypothetical protein